MLLLLFNQPLNFIPISMTRSMRHSKILAENSSATTTLSPSLFGIILPATSKLKIDKLLPSTLCNCDQNDHNGPC